MELLKTKPDKQIRKWRRINVDDAIKKAARFRRLKDSKGWADYVQLLNDYVDKAKKRKVATRLDIADERTLAELRMLDHEIWFIENFVKIIPTMFITGLDAEIKRIKKEEESNAE